MPQEPTNAEEAFAELLALREKSGDGAPTLEDWIRRYPQHEAGLRQLESDWRGFDALLRGALRGDSADSVFHRTPHAGPAQKSFVEFAPERVIGDFRLIRRIGQGGMGEVWEAEQVSLRRRVALKFIRPDRLNTRAQAYFDREARASGRLNHPGIVAVHATGVEGGLHWIAQELVPGSSSLNDFLRSVRPGAELPRDYFDRVARFVAELCDALQAAHESDVIHRDVKPHNILITREDHPKLTDFGLARLTDEAALSGSYAVKGTPIYMSPEQVAGKAKLIDHRTDVFSTGAVLFEMLTLRRAFEGDSSQVMARISAADAPDARKVRPEVPFELAAIAQKALERRPADRYLTSAEMAADLRRYLTHQPVRARPAGPLRRAAKWVRRHPTATSIATALLVLAGTAWFLLDQAQRASERGDLARKEALLTRAWRKIDAGDLDGARAEIAGFDELFPGDPDGHLVMAAGYARSFLQTAMEQELARAAEIGGAQPPSHARDTALGLFLEALGWLAVEKSASYERVQRNLERALELDPKLEVALYPLYVVRMALRDAAGAREALTAYRGTLRTSNPAVPLVDAMLLELGGDYEQALERLEGLRTEIGDEEFSSLRGFRALGRVSLKAFEARPSPGPERLSQAQAALERAVQDVAADSAALANLAQVHLRKYWRTPSAEERATHLDRARTLAEQSLAIDPEQDAALEVLATVGWLRFRGARAAAERDRAAQALAAVLDELEALNPESRTLAAVRSDVLAFEGEQALAADRVDLAFERFLSSARLYDLQLPARVMLGQIEWMEGDYASSLQWLTEAESVLEQSAARQAPFDPRWRFAVYVWGLGAADKLGELNLAFGYAEKARETLDAGVGIELPEVYSLAEFIATTEHAELRDCAFVRRLCRDFPIEQQYGDVQPEVWRRINAACPPE